MNARAEETLDEGVAFDMVLAAWGDRVEDGLQGLFDFIPNLIGFLIVLAVGYLLARLLAGVLARVLARSGVDRALTEGQGGGYVAKLTRTPSRLLARVVFWALMLGVVALAVSVLGIESLTAFVGAIFAYLPNVLAALLIFLVAGAIAAGLAALARRTLGETATGRVVAAVAPVVVMAIAAFMILDQLEIAPDIVRITYTSLIAGLALALALAFGLGGRDVAARMLEGAYVRGQASRDQVRRDLALGRERARADFEERIEGDAVTGPPSREPGRITTATGTGVETPTYTTSGDVEDVERVGFDELDDVPPGSVDPGDPGHR